MKTPLVEHVNMIVLWGAGAIVMEPDHVVNPPTGHTLHWLGAVGGTGLSIRATPQDHLTPPYVVWHAYMGACDAYRNADGHSAQEAVDSLRGKLIGFRIELTGILGGDDA